MSLLYATGAPVLHMNSHGDLTLTGVGAGLMLALFFGVVTIMFMLMGRD